ncbi:hypothetical protein D3C76_1527110 [compost metagenome]
MQVGRQLLQLRRVLAAEGYTGSGAADQTGEMRAQAGAGIGHQDGLAGHGKRLHGIAHGRASAVIGRRVIRARGTGIPGDGTGAAPSIFNTSSE